MVNCNLTVKILILIFSDLNSEPPTLPTAFTTKEFSIFNSAEVIALILVSLILWEFKAVWYDTAEVSRLLRTT